MRVVFAHGLESGPRGRKTTWLERAGHEVIAPDCRNASLVTRTDLVTAALEQHEGAVLVGSSFGGLVALLAASRLARAGRRVDGVLLLAPAIVLPIPPGESVALPLPWPTTVIHGTRDEVLAIGPVHAWALEHGARWIERDDDHSLGTSRDAILQALADLAPTQREASGSAGAVADEDC